jgi:hypothetical protein
MTIVPGRSTLKCPPGGFFIQWCQTQTIFSVLKTLEGTIPTKTTAGFDLNFSRYQVKKAYCAKTCPQHRNQTPLVAQCPRFDFAAPLRPLRTAIAINLHLRCMQKGLALHRATLSSLWSSPYRSGGRVLWSMFAKTTRVSAYHQPLAL